MSQLKAIVTVLAIAMTIGAWLIYSEHPTSRNLRRAVLDTLETPLV